MKLVHLALLLLGLFSATALQAEQHAPTVKDIIEADERSLEVAEQLKDQNQSIKPGETPLSALISLREAIVADDWEKAVTFLDTRYLPDHLKDHDPITLLKHLSIVWNQHRIIDLSEISNHPEGHQNDNLPSYRDLLGTIPLGDGAVPIYLQRVPDGNGNKIWKISNATVKEIPELWEEYGYNATISKLADYLPQFQFLHMQNWQFIALILMVIGAWAFTYGFRWLSLFLLERSNTYRDTMHRFFAFPFRWYLFFLIMQKGVSELGLSLKARVYLNESALGYIAYTFLILAAIEFLSALFLTNNKNNQYWSGIIRPIRTICKILAVIIIALAWLNEAGYNISTILAGLGIGSLALALAAQKTLENVIGAITLYIAQPIRPGDYCNFGDISGVIEEIGLRSTRVRRLDRTVVHVPNSVMVSANLENVSETDRRRYNKKIRVSLATNIDQLRLTVLKLRELVLSHPRILDVAARARFNDIERDAFVITINCYVNTSNIVEFFAVEEDLNLRIVTLLDALGVQLAVPEQKLVVSAQTDLSPEKYEAAKQEIAALLENDKLAFPDFTDEEKEALRGSIEYPDLGRGETPNS